MEEPRRKRAKIAGFGRAAAASADAVDKTSLSDRPSNLEEPADESEVSHTTFLTSNNARQDSAAHEAIKPEHLAAEASRLPPTRLSDLEQTNFALHYSTEATRQYLCLRNHILRLWQRNCHHELTWSYIENELSSMPEWSESLAKSIFIFLTRHGFVNFGVFHQHGPSFPLFESDPSHSKGRIAVIGAGAAGLAAARHLRFLGHQATVFEARSRVGGRVHTMRYGRHTADRGAMVVTGLWGNPLTTLINQLNVPLHRLRSSCPLYDVDGSKIDDGVADDIETKFNDLLAATKDVVQQHSLMTLLGDSQPSLGDVLTLLERHEEIRQLEFRKLHLQQLADLSKEIIQLEQTVKRLQDKLSRTVARAKSAGIALMTPLALGCKNLPNPHHACTQYCAERTGQPLQNAPVMAFEGQDDRQDLEPGPSAAQGTSMQAGHFGTSTTDVSAAPLASSPSQQNHRDLKEPAYSGKPFQSSVFEGVAAPADSNASEATNADTPHQDDIYTNSPQILQQQIKTLGVELLAQKDALAALRSRQLKVAAKLPGQHMTPATQRVVDWLVANLEFANCTSLSNLSLLHWDQDDEFECSGAHMMPRPGFDVFVRCLANGLDIRKDSAVDSVEVVEDGVAIEIAQERHIFDAVVVAVPLGVLKASRPEKCIRFIPDLPSWKQDVINQMGFGRLEKVILCFSQRFWDDSKDFFGFCGSSEFQRGQHFTFWNMSPPSGQPTLVALNAGPAAEEMHKTDKDEIVASALEALKRMFGRDVVAPLVHSEVTNWQSDPYSRGSYSYVSKTCSGKAYDELARPVHILPSGRPSVFFAGEHTCRSHPATVHGALLSGLRAAAEVDQSLQCSMTL